MFLTKHHQNITENSFRPYIEYERFVVCNGICKEVTKPYEDEVRRWTDTTLIVQPICSIGTKAAALISALKQGDISKRSFSV